MNEADSTSKDGAEFRGQEQKLIDTTTERADIEGCSDEVQLELQAKQNALNLEALDEGHSIARHGPEISDAHLLPLGLIVTKIGKALERMRYWK